MILDASGQKSRNKHPLRSSLFYSMLEGSGACVMLALVDTFAVPALLTLGAEEMATAALPAAAFFLTAFANWAAPEWSARTVSRKRFVSYSVLGQALACIGIGLIGYLPSAYAIPAAIAAYALYAFAGSVGAGPWVSWMSDLVPQTGRGRFFARRSVILGSIQGVTALVAGLLLSFWKSAGVNAPWTAFATIFFLAGMGRFVSFGFLTRQFEPPMKSRPPAKDFTFRQFLKKTGESNFANFALALALLNGGTMFAGPLFNVWFLRDLKLTYFEYTLIPTTALASMLIFVRFWGRLADRFGNLLVIRLCAPGVVLTPLLYLGPTNMAYMCFNQIIGGAVWAGLNLAAFNYVLEAATPARRARCFSYMTATVGAVCALFLLAGGRLAPHLPTLFEYRLQTVFLCSAVLRLFPALVLMFGIKQLSEKPKAAAMDLFYELPAVRPTAGVLRHLARPFRRI
jgi:MFS family permease